MPPSTSYDTPQRTMAYPKIDCAATICVAPDPLPSTSSRMSNKCTEEDEISLWYDVQLQQISESITSRNTSTSQKKRTAAKKKKGEKVRDHHQLTSQKQIGF